jgi:hypothetical protein
MQSVITESHWVGMTVEDANERAKGIGYTCRIVEENGVSFMVNADVRSNRLNLRIRDGKIIGLYTG